MKIELLICACLVSMTPAFAQESTGLNGRHIGPYGGGGNPYRQPGGGISSGFRTPEGNPLSTTALPQNPPPLPARPSWDTQSNTGHSTMYQQWQQTQTPQPAAIPFVQPATPAQPQEQTQGTQPAVASTPRPTYASTITEIAEVLSYDVHPNQPLNYLTWYMNGAQIDPKSVLKNDADSFEVILRQMVADDLVSTWNLTMQDTFLRVLLPVLLFIAIWKGIEFLFSKTFGSNPRRS